MSLQALPPELIQKIINHLTWSSLEPFSRTSRRHYALSLPTLRAEAVLLSSDGRTLRPQATDVAAALPDAASVVVASPVPDESVGGNIRGRCPGCNLKDFEGEGEASEPLVHEALGLCRPGRLRKFTWLLGVCVQDDILGSTGILPTQQPNLEEIRLITCYHRLGIRCQTRTLDLTPFAKLHTLSWTGIHRSQFRVVERALATLASQLVTLELDYLSSTANRDAEVDQGVEPGYLIAFLLSLEKEGEEVVFPKLENLSLTNVILETQLTGELCAALNAPYLKSLKLKQCPGWRSFISGMNVPLPGLPRNLCALEVHSFPREDDRDRIVADALGQTLRACPYLEELNVYRVNGTAAFPESGLLLQHLELRHLRRVVIHEVSPLTGSMGVGRNWPDMQQLLPVGGAEINLLSHGMLEFLGYAGPTAQVKTLLDNLTLPDALVNLRVLHVRQDHEEVSDYHSRALGHALPDKGALGRINLWRMLTRSAYDLATWAFTTPRLPSLAVLAFGDFGSFDPRFRLLLCRSDSAEEKFRVVREGDGEVVSVLDEYLDSLVVGPTYSRPYLRSSGASLAGNVWRGGLGRGLARESEWREPTIPRKVDGAV